MSVSHVYYTKYLQIDEDDFDRFELLSEGFMGGAALFLVRLSHTRLTPIGNLDVSVQSLVPLKLRLGLGLQ